VRGDGVLIMMSMNVSSMTKQMRQSSYCTKMRFRFAPYSMRDVGTEH